MDGESFLLYPTLERRREPAERKQIDFEPGGLCCGDLDLCGDRAAVRRCG